MSLSPKAGNIGKAVACAIALAMVATGSGCANQPGTQEPEKESQTAPQGQKSHAGEVLASGKPATKEDLDKVVDETVLKMEGLADAFEEDAKAVSGDKEKDLAAYFDAGDRLSVAASLGTEQLSMLASESQGLDVSEHIKKIKERYDELAEKELDTATKTGLVDRKELDAMLNGSQQEPVPEGGQAI